jgi:hypothetical protein
MRSVLLPLVCACLAVGLPRPALAGQPEPITPPPEQQGTGFLAWGGAGVGLGIAGIAGGTAMWISLGDGGGVLGVIPIVFGSSWIVLGGVGIHVGNKRRLALRDWEARAGMDLQTYRRIYEPGRPARSGVGTLSAGITSLVVGACVAGPGFAYLPPLATYEPGDERVALATSITGTILLVAGATTLVMGSIQRYRYLHHRRVWVQLRPYPWATRSAAGFGLAGRF